MYVKIGSVTHIDFQLNTVCFRKKKKKLFSRIIITKSHAATTIRKPIFSVAYYVKTASHPKCNLRRYSAFTHSVLYNVRMQYYLESQRRVHTCH